MLNIFFGDSKCRLAIFYVVNKIKIDILAGIIDRRQTDWNKVRIIKNILIANFDKASATISYISRFFACQFTRCSPLYSQYDINIFVAKKQLISMNNGQYKSLNYFLNIS